MSDLSGLEQTPKRTNAKPKAAACDRVGCLHYRNS